MTPLRSALTPIYNSNKMKKQTAVEWLVNELIELGMVYPLSIGIEKINQAKEMEKQQIMNAVDVGFEEGSKFPEDIKLNDAEQYYNETFTEQPQK